MEKLNGGRRLWRRGHDWSMRHHHWQNGANVTLDIAARSARSAIRLHFGWFFPWRMFLGIRQIRQIRQIRHTRHSRHSR